MSGLHLRALRVAGSAAQRRLTQEWEAIMSSRTALLLVAVLLNLTAAYVHMHSKPEVRIRYIGYPHMQEDIPTESRYASAKWRLV